MERSSRVLQRTIQASLGDVAAGSQRRDDSESDDQGFLREGRGSQNASEDGGFGPFIHDDDDATENETTGYMSRLLHRNSGDRVGLEEELRMSRANERDLVAVDTSLNRKIEGLEAALAEYKRRHGELDS